MPMHLPTLLTSCRCEFGTECVKAAKHAFRTANLSAAGSRAAPAAAVFSLSCSEASRPVICRRTSAGGVYGFWARRYLEMQMVELQQNTLSKTVHPPFGGQRLCQSVDTAGIGQSHRAGGHASAAGGLKKLHKYVNLLLLFSFVLANLTATSATSS